LVRRGLAWQGMAGELGCLLAEKMKEYYTMSVEMVAAIILIIVLVFVLYLDEEFTDVL